MRLILVLTVVLINTVCLAGKKDAIIHDDFMSVHVSGKKGAFIYFTVTRIVRVKIQTEQGLDRFQEISLPIPFDPTYFVHAPEARNVGYYLSRITIQNFKTKILRSGEQIARDDYNPEVTELKSVDHTDDFYKTFAVFNYRIDDLKVGDELEITYRYNFPYDENFYRLSSLRFFFHGEYFKKHQKLRLSLSTGLMCDLVFTNGADPDSINEIDKKKVYVWENWNLPGCLNEPGSRAYKTLPHVIFSLKPWELLYTVPYTYKEVFIPYYAIAVGFREKEHIDILRAAAFGVNTRQYEKLDQFLRDKAIAGSEDSTGYENLYLIHEAIVDEFEFDNDIEYFNSYVPYDERLGSYALSHKIRDISRFDLYVGLISKLGLGYFTAYIADRRMGEITADYFAPMFENDYLIAVFLSNGTIHFILPKSSRFGLYLNELPFYYENTTVRLVSVNDYANIKTAIQDIFRNIKTPGSDVMDNVRMNNILTNVDLENNLVSFEAKVSLAGQYSTMIRGSYLYDIVDTTVNSLYYKKIWEINQDISLNHQKVSVLRKEYPYNTSVQAKYNSKQMLSKQQDSIYTIDCSGWFHHVVEELDTTNRYLCYYPDFMGRDTYNYLIKFNQDVSLLDYTGPIQISNDFGEFTFSCEQINSNSIKLSSYLSIFQHRVPAQDIGSIARLFEAAKLNQTSVTIAVKKPQ